MHAYPYPGYIKCNKQPPSPGPWCTIMTFVKHPMEIQYCMFLTRFRRPKAPFSSGYLYNARARE